MKIFETDFHKNECLIHMCPKKKESVKKDASCKEESQ